MNKYSRTLIYLSVIGFFLSYSIETRPMMSFKHQAEKTLSEIAQSTPWLLLGGAVLAAYGMYHLFHRRDVKPSAELPQLSPLPKRTANEGSKGFRQRIRAKNKKNLDALKSANPNDLEGQFITALINDANDSSASNRFDLIQQHPELAQNAHINQAYRELSKLRTQQQLLETWAQDLEDKGKLADQSEIQEFSEQYRDVIAQQNNVIHTCIQQLRNAKHQSPSRWRRLSAGFFRAPAPAT